MSTYGISSSTPKYHAFAMDPIADLDAYAISQMISKRELSTAEAIRYFIGRIDHLNPQLNAVCHRNNNLALAHAHRLDSRPPEDPKRLTLKGIPTLIKDNINVAGMPTTHGSDAVKPKPLRSTDPFAQQLFKLDMICLGKSAMPEFGLNATTEPLHNPPTHNPWCHNISSGGSSGGAAAAVASGMVPIAHGNDGGGSIRIPASCCGLVGLKPTNGRLRASHLGEKLPIKIVNDGVITRSVRDTALFYALAEQQYRDPKLPLLGQINGPSTRRLKVGYLRNSITDTPTDSSNLTVLDQTIQQLSELGHIVEPVDILVDQNFIKNFSHYWAFLAFNLHHFGGQLLHSSYRKKDIEPFTLWLSKYFAASWYQLPMTLYRLHRVRNHYRHIFRQLDVVLTPTLAQQPVALGWLKTDIDPKELLDRLINYASFTPLNNASGGPGITLPLGKNHQGVPIGMHFSADLGDEKTLIELAYELEQTSLWQPIKKPHAQATQATNSHFIANI